jgi:cysteine desulfurase
VAALLAAQPDELVFTSCGSESDALAVQGAAEQARRDSGRAHLIVSAVEHEAVLESFRCLELRGFRVDVLPVDRHGRTDPEELRTLLRDDTALVSVMAANNEVGTLQPVRELAAACRERGALFHTDAVQAAGKLPLDVKELGADLLSLSGHKLNAPKGVGALYVRRGVALTPLVTGKHEKRRRGGTENVPGIVAFGAAAELARRELATHPAELRALRTRLEEGVLRIAGVRLNGHPTERLPNTSHFCFEEADGHSLLVALDLEGVCVSTGSACSTGSSAPSHVLSAMKACSESALGAMRVSLGWGTGEAEVSRFLELLPGVIEKARRAHRALSA